MVAISNYNNYFLQDTLGKLEEDFKNGPVKRLEKIENMLNEMGRDKVRRHLCLYMYMYSGGIPAMLVANSEMVGLQGRLLM